MISRMFLSGILLLFLAGPLAAQSVFDNDTNQPTPAVDGNGIDYIAGATAGESEVNKMVADWYVKHRDADIDAAGRNRFFTRLSKLKTRRRISSPRFFNIVKGQLMEEMYLAGASEDDLQSPQLVKGWLEDVDWQKFFNDFLKPLIELLIQLFADSGALQHNMTAMG